jgi:3-methyladenine DNA glycosylase Mpg
MCGEVLFIEDRGEPPDDIMATTRIGIDKAGPWRDKLWRFYVCDHASVSKR